MTHKFINRSIQPKHNGRPTAQALHGYSYINEKYSWKMCLLLLNSFFFFRKIKNDSFGRCLSFSSLLSSLPCNSCIHITYCVRVAFYSSACPNARRSVLCAGMYDRTVIITIIAIASPSSLASFRVGTVRGWNMRIAYENRCQSTDSAVGNLSEIVSSRQQI